MTLSRRAAVQASCAALLPLAPRVAFAAPAYHELTYGDAKAKVTVIEYASLTCHFCADFAVNVFPEIRKNYIDTGKVHFVFRDFPTDGLATAGAMVCRCAPPEKGTRLLETLYKNQLAWVQALKPIDPLRDFARLAGMSDDDVNSCLQDQALLTTIREEQNKAATLYRVERTPTFYVGDEVVLGVKPYGQWTKLLDAHLKLGR